MLPRVFQKKVTLLVSAPYSDLMQQVIQYIEEHLTENISFSDVSQRFNIPERTLARWFKDEIGMSMFQFVKIARIQKALELMENEQLNINEIVYGVGYQSLSTFSSLFKGLLGVSPTQYRRQSVVRSL